MATIVTAPRAFIPETAPSPLIAHLTQNQKHIRQDLQAIASKLKGLDSQTLGKLQKSFFETASTQAGKLAQPSTQAAFAVKSPAEAMAANFATLCGSYFAPDAAKVLEKSLESRSSDSKPEASKGTQQTDSLRPDAKPARAQTYGMQSKSPGLFSNPVADKAAEAARQSQTQTQNFLANQLGQSFASGNMAEFLGPNACFEDVLATVMMNIADKSEKEMLEQIRIVERGETGLNGFMANRAKDLGGIAGGALGGILGGPQGATIGYDVGERLVGNYAGQYGGSSRQIQFEKLKMMMHKQSEMMSAISNILATIHATNKNSISNIRG